MNELERASSAVYMSDVDEILDSTADITRLVGPSHAGALGCFLPKLRCVTACPTQRPLRDLRRHCC